MKLNTSKVGAALAAITILAPASLLAQTSTVDTVKGHIETEVTALTTAAVALVAVVIGLWVIPMAVRAMKRLASMMLG